MWCFLQTWHRLYHWVWQLAFLFTPLPLALLLQRHRHVCLSVCWRLQVRPQQLVMRVTSDAAVSRDMTSTAVNIVVSLDCMPSSTPPSPSPVSPPVVPPAVHFTQLLPAAGFCLVGPTAQMMHAQETRVGCVCVCVLLPCVFCVSIYTSMSLFLAK